METCCEAVTFVMQSRDEDGNTLDANDDTYVVTVTHPDGTSSPVTAAYQRDGLYKAMYTPTLEGTYTVNVAMTNDYTSTYTYATPEVGEEFTFFLLPSDAEARANLLRSILAKTMTAEAREAMVDKTLAKIYMKKAKEFNNDGKNPDRIDDITEAELEAVIQDVVADQNRRILQSWKNKNKVSKGNGNGYASANDKPVYDKYKDNEPADTTYDLDSKFREKIVQLIWETLDFDLESEVMAYDAAVEAANNAIDTYELLVSDLVKKDKDYFTCDNDVFADLEWCTSN